jgi:rhodanese-related sulfurtransferase
MAEEYRQKGFLNVKALKGGVEGWKKAGFPTQL